MTSRRTPLTLALLTALAVGFPGALHGQDEEQQVGDTAKIVRELPDSALVDRVVAVVGDSAITQSEVGEGLLVAERQGQQTTPEQVLESLINSQLILQAAARDTTLEVTDAELDERVEAAVDEIRGRFTTETEFQEALRAQGLTPTTYREQLREQLRADQLRNMFVQRQLQSGAPVPITEEEMRAFFEEQRGALQQRPEMLTVRQLMVPVEGSETAWAEAERLADSLRAAIVSEGADFAELAQEFSQDPGSAQEGGDLGWFRQGAGFVREFEQAAFRLPRDSVSQPVRTRFGYHLIKVDRRRPGEVKARHILVRPEVVGADVEQARARAEEAAARIREGADFETLRDEYGDTEQRLDFTISRDQVGELPPGYAERIREAAEGDLIGPFETRLGAEEFYTVLDVVEVREAGEFTFEDLEDQIRQALTRQKRIERLYQRLRDQTYVDVRM